MSETPSDPSTKVDEIKSQVQGLITQVKEEVTQRLDQLLDEIGALI